MSEHASVPADGHGAHGDDDHGDMNLWVIGGYLLVLTGATFLTLFLPRSVWGPMTNTLFVLMIAACKASLVVGFFMHFRYEKAWKFFLTIPPLILAVMGVCALLPDVAIGTYPLSHWVVTGK